jgi:hypothetical protein
MIPILLLSASLLVYYFYYLGRKILIPALLALGFALFITGFHHYEYVGVQNLYVGPFNLYPLICWPAGLLTLKIIYDRMTLSHKFFWISILYLVLLAGLEYVAYEWLNIRTVGGYPSLFGLDIIHGPPLIHSFYIFAGPVYIALLESGPLQSLVSARITTTHT